MFLVSFFGNGFGVGGMRVGFGILRFFVFRSEISYMGIGVEYLEFVFFEGLGFWFL